MRQNAVCLMSSLSVNSYPHLPDTPIEQDQGGQWIAGEARLVRYVERWVLFRSGQFVHNFSLPEVNGLGDNVHYLEVLKTVTAVFEFARRMARSGALDAEARVGIEIHNIVSRGLAVPDGNGGVDFSSTYWAKTPRIGLERRVSAGILGKRSAEFALDAAIEIYEGFGWREADRGLLASNQQRFH